MSKTNRFNIEAVDKALTFLQEQAFRYNNNDASAIILLILDKGDSSQQIESLFNKNGITFFASDKKNLGKIPASMLPKINCVIAGFFDPMQIHELGKMLVQNNDLCDIPFEFAIIPERSYRVLYNHDWQDSKSFISPLLISDIDVFTIYEESLQLFEKKCQIRDYLDLAQLVLQVVSNRVQGDFAEFGSLKGHSGYLIARLLKASCVFKHFYMFDLFGEPATESIGIDLFWNKIWNNIRRPDLDEIKEKFSDFQNVTFVKGDFTKTLHKAKLNNLSFIFIDCDSYRGTKFILENLFDDQLSQGGIVVLEDYGHAPLVGNRIAFHEFFDKRNDCFRFFSQFSGFQVVLKM
jgi:hypothetical protein